MFDNLKALIFSQTSKDTAVVFFGTFINALTGGIFFIIAPRILGPAQYGLFAVVTSTSVMISNFANFGIPTGILKFNDPSDPDHAGKILKLAFKSYLIIGLAVFIVGLLLSGFLAQALGKEQLTPLLRIAFATVIFFLLTEFFTVVLQANRHFAKAAIVNISSNLARLIVLAAGAYFFTINLYYLTILFFSAPLISIIIGKLFVPFDFLKTQDDTKLIKEFFKYNFWVAAGLAISSIPFNSYLLLKLAGPLYTGLYAAPYKFLTVIDQLSGNFSRVLATRFSSFENRQAAITYSKKAVPIVLVVSAAIVFMSFFASPIVKLLLGSEYTGSIIIFRLVSISYAIYFTQTITVSLIIYYFGKPSVRFWLTLVSIIIWVGGSTVLIPKFGATGAAISDVITSFVSLLLFSAYIIWKFKNGPN